MSAATPAPVVEALRGLLLQVVRDAYAAGTTDEFIPPVVMVDDQHRPVAPVRDGDVVEFRFNV